MASPDLVRILLGTYLFQDVSPVQLEPLVAASQVRDYSEGQFVLRAGDRADELYVLLSGLIKESMPTTDGFEYVPELLHPGGIFGEPGIFVPERTRVVDELVLKDASVLVIPRESLWRFLLQHPPVMLRLIEGLAVYAREAIEVMAGIAPRRVRERVIFRLLELAATQGRPEPGSERLRVRVSQPTLAGMVGASRENVNRAIASLASEGYLSYRAGVFVIDADRLRRANPASSPLLPRRNMQLADVD